MKNLDAVNIEQSVLGSFIVDESLGYKLEELSECMFTVNYNKHILCVMKDLYKCNKSLDIQTISTMLVEGGYGININYLSSLVAISQSYAIDTHIGILKDKYLRREIIKNCSNLFQALGDSEDINSVVYNFEDGMQKILKNENVDEEDSISSTCERLLYFLENDEDRGMKFGIKFLDSVIGGLFKGELTTIAARSGVGKTALALQIMLNCMEQDKKVLFISREMSNIQVFMRNITKRSGVSTKSMKNKDLDDDSWKTIIGIMEEFSRRNLIYINDRISTISELRRRIRQIKPDLVIVDYIQLMSIESSMQNREREVASLSRELKKITLDFDIPVIQLSQLNDEMKDMRPHGERPMRDSKAIFHDSNNVIYIHEPMYSDFDDAIDRIRVSRNTVLNYRKKGVKLVDLIIAKCRDGETKMRHYYYHGSRLHFEHIHY